MDTQTLLAVRDLLRRDDYAALQFVPFAAHTTEYSTQHLAALIEDEKLLLASAAQNEPVLYAYSLNPEHYARRLSRRQRLLGDLFLYNRPLPGATVRQELPEYYEHALRLSTGQDELRCPLRIVPVFDALLVADPIDAAEDTHVFLHNDSVQMARYLNRSSCFQGKVVADVGTGSGILAVMACKRGAARVIAVDINPRAVAYAKTTCLLNDCAQIEVREGSIESVVREADVIVSNPPYMSERTALSLAGGGRFGMGTAIRFVRCAIENNRYLMLILEVPTSGGGDTFLEELNLAPSTKRVLRQRPGFDLAVYEFGSAG
jgi:SAM-dependent methyltransferase